MRKRWQALVLTAVITATTVLGGCGTNGGTGIDKGTLNKETINTEEDEKAAVTALSYMQDANTGDLQIYDDNYRTYYEVFLYSYYDSDGDGIGDIQGLIDKLDYINDGDDATDTDLGFTGIWLMPIMPSTTYHKYDVTDYENINEEYGTLDDFKDLLAASHERGINVIIDFVMNHTSSEHPWFKEACSYIENLDGAEPNEADCKYFGYYNFTKEPKGDIYYQVGDTDWYYEAPFWSEMPDLNLANENVRNEMDEITSFWLDMGVDGFRLDAAGEYYSGQNDKNVEVLTWFNDMVKAKKDDAYIVAEVWQDLDTYSKYYASGVDSFFDFSFANADGIIANSLKHVSGDDATTYGKAVDKLDDTFGQYNENYIDAPFYTNHDMGRSAGYYSGDYSENMTKMAGAMNLFMSGSAFVYYGEELGMKGSGKDENKRAPMLWSEDSAAEGMCDGPADMESIKMKYGSLEEQVNDPDSIYNFYKQTILLRNQYPEIARGDAQYNKELSTEDVCVLQKMYDDDTIQIVFNMSDKEQTVDMSGIMVEDDAGADFKLKGMLVTTDEPVTYKEAILTMPAYSVAIVGM